MTTRIVGALAVTAAAILLTFAVFYQKHPKPSEKLAFAKALDSVSAAKTAHLKVTRNEKTAQEIWSEKGGRLRVEDGTEFVYLSDGELIWKLNEKTGKAEREKQKPAVDPLGLVLAGEKYTKFDASKRTPDRETEDILTYFIAVEAPNGAIQLEATVDAKSKQLKSIQASDKNRGVFSKLEVVKLDGEIPDDRFAALNSLSEDGRVGKVVDTQGVVTVKPLNAERWTPVAANFVVMPGDWVRTDTRGANAANVKLLSRSGLILGPAALAEIVKANVVKMHSGEVEISVPKGGSVELHGPDEQKVVVKGTQIYQVTNNQKLQLVAKEPMWLQGFKGTTANESLGSLIAKVDGRNVPLSVGYHKVTVDIRDQIARTVIEESFVNHTDATLEGVFHFPLPQDASISGFGMWIGNELVEADVVEKQRAREIYETILRERRDPGLLEWAGGNIFKARVFPIWGHSEKRIKITYTQVLPLRGSTYRYSYALQSELLQQHPLRDLSLAVNVYSATPLKKVSSPTHNTREQMTRNSAKVEFTAQEYTPTKDFEVAIEQDERANDIVMVPHRRGDDGYFMLQVMPPATGDARDVLPDAGPLQLLILADTSASMDKGQRHKQDAFVAALLSTLTPRDSFNLAAFDVNCDWAFEKPITAEPKNLVAARQMLEKRVSLGWTDLDKAFDSVMRQAGANTHVVYVGDGIPTTRDADAVAFTQRLKRMYDGKSGTFHAIALGSSFESGVLKTIASLGGGSMRRVTSDQGPAAVAMDLMREIAKPTLRDMKIEFTGLRTARVYPSELPNVPAGTQQIILGRYLPDAADQKGEVTVSGTLNGKTIRMTAPIALKGEGKEESFIPRLWARQHLDVLLAQGTSEATKDEVIALSEEYNIITPYTSFLVLESDADRERFGVKKRFRMRDGEKFFAKGRDNVNYELVQQQMKRAGTWRLNLRAAVMRDLARLGRNSQVFNPNVNYNRNEWAEMNQPLGASAPMSAAPMSGPFGGPTGSGGGGRAAGGPGGMPNVYFTDGIADGRFRDVDFLTDAELGTARELGDFKSLERSKAKDSPDEDDEKKDKKVKEDPAEPAPDAPAGAKDDETSAEEGKLSKLNSYDADRMESLRQLDGESGSRPIGPMNEPAGGLFTGRGTYEYFRDATPGRKPYGAYYDYEWQNANALLNSIFPALPAAPGKFKEPKTKWSEPARKLALTLLRTDALATLNGGLEFRSLAETWNAETKDLSARSRTRSLYSPKSWLNRFEGDGAQTLISWAGGKEVGAMSKAFLLGRLRNAKPDDLKPHLGLPAGMSSPLWVGYEGFSATVEEAGKDRVRLRLKNPNSADAELVFVIDTARSVLVEETNTFKGKVTARSVYSDFVEVGGNWWTGKIEHFNDKDVLVARTVQTVKALTDEALAAEVKAELALREQVQFLREPAVKLADAKKAVADGKATFDDHLALLRHFAQIQQWSKVDEHFAALEKLSPGKTGMRWVRDAVWQMSRKFELLRKRQLDEADRLAKLPADQRSGGDALTLANHLLNQAPRFVQAQEMIQLLDNVRPIYESQPPHLQTKKQWMQNQANWLSAAGRGEEALVVWKQLATDYPRDEYMQRAYTDQLVNRGDYSAAYAWLEKALAAPHWSANEEGNLRETQLRYLHQQGRHADVAKYLEGWLPRNPERLTPYQMYLSVLVWLDKEEQANELIAKWLKDGLAKDEMKPDVASRLQAAIYQALGQGYNLYTNRLEDRWLEPLAAVAKTHAKSEKYGNYADTIMNHQSFAGSDQARRLRGALTATLPADAENLSVYRMASIVNWLLRNDPEVAKATWQQAVDALKKRWTADVDDYQKNTIAQNILTILRNRFEAADVLAFLRLQLESGPKEQRPNFARQLFNELLAQPWTAAYEDEAFRLISRLTDSEDGAVQMQSRVSALHYLTDKVLASRYAALYKLIEHPEKLTRTDLKAKQDALRKQARTEYSDRLAKDIGVAALADWANWLKMERVYVDALLDRNGKENVEFAWTILGAAPPKPVEFEGDEATAAWLPNLLRDRAFGLVSYLATRKNADPALIARLFKFIDSGIAQDAENPTWREVKYRFLVALDKPKDLEEQLRKWIAAGGKEAMHWRLSLGFLVAELGRLEEAVKEFEIIEKADELGPRAYRTLADWYMVLNKRDQHEKALLASYKTSDENLLRQRIYQKMNPWQRGDRHLPSELDQDVLRMFKVLFEKSATPQNYLYDLQQFYLACRDFRLLEMLPDAVVGQTAGKVYPFLQNMGSVLTTIQDEAVVDQILEHMVKVRETAKTAVDHRALDLLEVLVLRRAAELKNQPGPHGDRAIAALKRAFDRQWTEGEQRLMADLLAHLGHITYAPMAQEQMREMDWLFTQQKKGTFDRLRIANHYARLHNGYGKTEAAIDLLTVELADYRQANKGVMPVDANDAVSSLVSYLESRKRHGTAEEYLKDLLKNPVHEQQQYTLTQMLYQVYFNAISAGTTVSLGSKQTLYQALEKIFRTALDDKNPGYAQHSLNQLCSLYRLVRDQNFTGYREDLRNFAFKGASELLKKHPNYYDQTVSSVAQTVHDLLSPKDGIAFLLDRIDDEPVWLRLNGQDGWNRHNGNLAYWRTEAKDIGDLEPRLLKLVLKELRLDLESRQQRSRSMYYRGYGYHWAEKEPDYLKVAEEIYAKRKNVGESVKYIAQYLYYGLGKTGRSIEILQIAFEQKKLDENGQVQLVTYLQEQGRHHEAIAILIPMIERSPANLDYRVRLMNGYFHVKQTDKLLATLKDADTFFHQKDRWNEGAMATLAVACVGVELWDKAIAYYDELIPLHQRTHPNGGVGTGTLSEYYASKATAYSRLGKTIEAVDAASGAIVAWGSIHRDRERYLGRLREVLTAAGNLDDYVAHLDKTEAESKQGSPILRKALGQAYLARNQFAKAATQYRAALDLQPEDADVHMHLIACYDNLGDKSAAVNQVLEAVQLSRRNLALYKNMGDRFKAMDDATEAERAYTSIVEMQPMESESHQMLADIRQQQNRWADAAPHWEMVAKIRALEPTGLLGLAKVQIHLQQKDKAAETLKKLEKTAWPQRFGNVQNEIQQLQGQLR